ncbi:MAG: hypothetical protein ACRDQW_09415 [Haloechinothrix sp.]
MSVDGRRGTARWVLPTAVVLALLVVSVVVLRDPLRGLRNPSDLRLQVQVEVVSDRAVAQQTGNELSGGWLGFAYAPEDSVYVVGQLDWRPPNVGLSGTLHLVVFDRVSGRAAQVWGALVEPGVAGRGWPRRLDSVVESVRWLAPVRRQEPILRQAASAPVDAEGPFTFVAVFDRYLQAHPQGLGTEDIVIGVILVAEDDSWWAELVTG